MSLHSMKNFHVLFQFQYYSDISTFWGASSSGYFEKYLGSPPVIGRGKRKALEDIKIWI